MVTKDFFGYYFIYVLEKKPGISRGFLVPGISCPGGFLVPGDFLSRGISCPGRFLVPGENPLDLFFPFLGYYKVYLEAMLVLLL